MRYPFAKSCVLALALSVALAGCTSSRLDATSYESLNASLNKARAALQPKDQKRFDQVRKQFNALYFANGKDTPRKRNLPDWRVVHGMTAGEFHSFVKTLRPIEEPEAGSTFPNPALAWRLLEQYKQEHALLIQNRQRQIDDGKNTIDQFPVVDFAYVPPMSNVPMEFDKAAFLVTIRNDSGFDAYKPLIHITVRNPKDSLPVLDNDFEFDTDRKPIEAKQQLTMRFECCNVAIDPLHNRLLKALPSDGSIEVAVKQIRGHNGADLIQSDKFSLRNAQRLKVLELCIQRIEPNLRTWVPYAEADQPGGCGDPDQADNLLAMWEKQGVTPPEEFRHLVFAPNEHGATAPIRPQTTPTGSIQGQVVGPDPQSHEDPGALLGPATSSASTAANSGSTAHVGSAVTN